MNTGILFINSLLHNQNRAGEIRKGFMEACEKQFNCREITKDEFESCEFVVLMVMTGGTENIFFQYWPALRRSEKHFVLAASETDNSLPASVEILSWLKQNEPASDVSIVHGTFDVQAAEIKKHLESASTGKPLKNRVVGVFGEPSDWLIASSPSLKVLERKTGIKFVFVSMDEFIETLKTPDPADIEAFKKEFSEKASKFSESDFMLSASIYAGLKHFIRKYDMSGVTLRCFDLLSNPKTTGCMALAKLNDEGICASCEGDVPSLLSMMIIKDVTGKASFMVNPSRVNGSEVTFAHCSCPTSILASYAIDTHFESGIGLAVAGEFNTDSFTMFRVDPLSKKYVLMHGPAMPHAYSPNLCRTQLEVELPGAARYFFNTPLGNHHILIPGNHVTELENWCESIGYTNVSKNRG